ncbi:MAG: YlxM family DNA-binding protein [Peptococcaceae bacterium]|nr:YlxM family DNA-binding protein [Peptococcaceae bacterium]
MKEITGKALLYDFYGPLLTTKQGNIWDLYYQQDYTLAEIAAEEGISRQAVHDLLKRTEKILESYEEKLGLISRFLREKEKLVEIQTLLDKISRDDFTNEKAWERQKDINSRIREIIVEALEDV